MERPRYTKGRLASAFRTIGWFGLATQAKTNGYQNENSQGCGYNNYTVILISSLFFHLFISLRITSSKHNPLKPPVISVGKSYHFLSEIKTLFLTKPLILNTNT